MFKLLKSIVPLFVKSWYNQYMTSNEFDVAFGKNTFSIRTSYEGKNFINTNVIIEDSFIGLATYISGNCKLKKIKIGKFCSLGQNIRNEFSLHPSSGYISTHPAFSSINKQAGFTFVNENSFDENKYADDKNMYYTIVGNDVWIGNDVKIMEGVTIGDGAIIGTGAIVTKDIPPYAIYGGVPARLIKKRFSDKQIEFLLDLKWWEKDISWIEKNAFLFNNFELFLNYLKKNE